MSTARRVKEPKNLQMSFRFSQRLRNVLEAIAATENRSLANALEVAVLHYARTLGLEEPRAKVTVKVTKKKAAKKE